MLAAKLRLWRGARAYELRSSVIRSNKLAYPVKRLAYQRSVIGKSVAPPGTAWDAEGPRGNAANENTLMLLAFLPARKRQSPAPFAQEDMAVG